MSKLNLLLVAFLCFAARSTFSQNQLSLSDSVLLEEVSVTAYKVEPLKETSLNITVLNVDSASKFGNYNITDLLAKIPGVSMLSTGVAIAKPVIRGLYGNRIVVLLNGLKFDNQQWQEEHGLGLSDVGLSRVELIHGPISMLYGSEAMGGVINLIEEGRPASNTPKFDFSFKLNSNTGGGTTQLGYRTNLGKHWFRIKAAYENNADYIDGNNQRVLNSRFEGSVIKVTEGFHYGKWTSVNNYAHTYNKFGFIFNDVYEFLKADERWSRDLSKNPAHFVELNIFSSENTILLNEKNKIHLNAGFQNNVRKENEGGGKISLNMHLNTFQYLFKFEHKINEKHRLIISNLNSIERNTNYGARKIVPNALMQESNLSIYYETNLHEKWIFENGIGAGEKWIQTLQTPSVNSAEKEIGPFTKFSPYANAFTGLSFNPNSKLNLKLNASSGVRIPNLAELSSNGLHEGVFTYEIGDPTMKNETNIMANLHTSYSDQRFDIWASTFYNQFFNYVYLSPTNEEWFGFPVYRYLQQDATQYGGELSASYTFLRGLTFSGTCSGMTSQTNDGNFTSFIPATKITPKLNYSKTFNQKSSVQLFAEYACSLAQNQVALNEIKTPAYQLLNGGISFHMNRQHMDYTLSFGANNVLNVAYYDHLSRFKYFGLLNPGANFTLQFKSNF